MTIDISKEAIDACLPQTQCGLCGYAGCMPYAEAIAMRQAPIHLCPPGGVKTLLALGELLQQDATPHLKEMQEKQKPRMLAKIREAECIGCTKCIQACPVDAIIGSGKRMHSVFSSLCTGCELCVPPCPVDCIDMLIDNRSFTASEEKEKAQSARRNYLARQQRLSQANQIKKQIKSTDKKDSLQTKRDYINAAIARVKAKKSG